MKFERLNSSIALNAREKPSIYMAICMVESLFRDVEDAAGKELSRAEPGDEQLPTKLIWLGRQLLKIYTENSDTMVRNRDRLDKMMEKVREQERTLAGLADTSGALHEAEQRCAALTEQLNEAEANREEKKRLEETCRQMRERLKQLEGADPTQVKAELEQLSARERQLSAQRTELLRELDRAKDAVSELETGCAGLQRDAARNQSRLQELEAARQTAQNKIAELNTAIAASSAALDAGNGERDKLLGEQAYLEQQIETQRRELDEYERVNMAPLRAERAENEQKLAALRQAFTAMKQERDDAVLQVARLTQQASSARQALDERKEDLRKRKSAADAVSAETDRLQKQADAETERLAALQREAADLEQNRLPKLQSLIAEQMQQNKQFADSIIGLEQRREKLLLEVERLKRDDEALSVEVEELRQTHDTLIARSEANNEAVQKLRRNVEELRGKNDREKEKRYRQQLEEERDKLTELTRTCEELERQLASIQTNLERKRIQAAELRQKKDEAEESLRRISSLMRELAPQGDPDLLRRVETLQSRQRLLEETHRSLEESVALMQNVLDIPPETLTTNPDGLSESLQQCGRALDKLQKALVRCANNIKSKFVAETIMEEQ